MYYSVINGKLTCEYVFCPGTTFVFLGERSRNCFCDVSMWHSGSEEELCYERHNLPKLGANNSCTGHAVDVYATFPWPD
jgi:hypothetical protein